jgi:hypothetical protein
MKYAIAIASIATYYVLVNLADLAIESTFLMAAVYLFVPLIAVPAAVFAGFASKERTQKVSDLRTKLRAAGFTATHEAEGLLLDANAGRIAFFEHRPNATFAHWVYSRKQLLGTEVIRDGHSVTKTSTSSLAGRALVGGVLLGGVGALLGGLTANSATKTTVRKLTLEIILNDAEHPVHRLSFLADPVGVATDSIVFRAAAERLEFAHALIELLIMDVKIPNARSTQDLQDTLKMLRLREQRA